jgi:DNA-binding helix-hairpin-helix protein with protein kinase domain
MNELLKSGQIVQTKMSGQPCKVKKFIGGGGQGEVYEAEWSGDLFALKWYYTNIATDEQRQALEELVQSDAPNAAFLWPLDIAMADNVPGFGYIMKLREPRFKGLLDLMMNRIDPKFRELVTVGLSLADNFFKLHAKGLCYRDISFGNAFFDPNTGEVLICDNDNVAANRSSHVSVLGTPDFMAPEIVRGQAKPCRETDLHSLAVLLFYIFHIHHPLMGKKMLGIKCWDYASRTKLFGAQPLFIFDPDDKSNEAVPNNAESGANALKYWPIYPQFLRNTFTEAFTSGLRDPEHGRVTEGEWRRVLSNLRDSIFYCGSCGVENFYDPETGESAGQKNNSCWSCKCQLQLPFRLQFGRSSVMLSHEGRIFPHHIGRSIEYEFQKAVGEVTIHPKDPNIWGLKNCSDEKWVATLPDNSMKDIEPGLNIRLSPKTKINFGKVTGEIVY